MKKGFLNTARANKTSSGTPTATKSVAQPVPQTSNANIKGAGKLLPEYSGEDWTVKELDPSIVNHPDPDLIITTCIPNPPPSGVDENQRSECIIRAHVKQKIYSTPGFPKVLPRHPSGLSDPCIVKESPGKGLGLFATRDIDAGERIALERPLLVAPAAVDLASSVNMGFFSATKATQAMLDSREKLHEISLGRMTPKNREAYMALSNAHTHDGSGPITGRLRTNGFGIQKGEAVEDDDRSPDTDYGAYSFVFDLLSRINHSCSPNTHRTWDTAHFAMIIRASRPIRRGEEITSCYCDLQSSRQQRQKQLAPYGIKCTCSICSLPQIQSGKSDQRREWTIGLISDPSVLAEAATWRDRCRKSGTTTGSDGGYFARLTKWARGLEDEGLQTLEIYTTLVKILAASFVVAKDDANAAIWRSKYFADNRVTTFKELPSARLTKMLKEEVEYVEELSMEMLKATLGGAAVWSPMSAILATARTIDF